MTQTLNYNIHDILKFRIVRNKGRGLKDLINLKFSYFEVEDVVDPDIILNIGRFVPKKEDCCTIDHKYHVKDNYFYCRDSEGGAKWEVEIIGFERGNTIINFSGEITKSPFNLNPDFVAQDFLLWLIEYKMSRKGYFLMHSASISRGDNAFVLTGRGGAFKTSLCMDFIRKKGYHFLGDDRTILHNNEVFCFPMGLPVFNFMCKNLSNEESWNLYYKFKFAKELWHTRNSYDCPLKILNQSNVIKFVFITKTNKKELETRHVPIEEAVQRLITNNRLEDFISLGCMGIKSGPHLKYTLAYSYIFPDSLIATQTQHLEKLLKSILEKTPLYEIEISENYDESSLERLEKLTEDQK